MAHEVVKHVGKRAYRYRVESYRDPATGKVRGRWTYLGRAEPDGEQLARSLERARPAVTREKLLCALADLLETEPWSAVTAGEVSKKAGVAHGTFYRYFRDKREALHAAFDRWRDELERERPALVGPLGARDDERERLRAWVALPFAAGIARPGLLRAWFTVVAEDPAWQIERAAKRAQRVEEFAGYLERLVEGRLIEPVDARGLATALLAIVEGQFRMTVLEGIAIDQTIVQGAVDAFDRAVFGRI